MIRTLNSFLSSEALIVIAVIVTIAVNPKSKANMFLSLQVYCHVNEEC